MDQIISRYRHETRRRNLRIRETHMLTPNMMRMELAGDDLSDFVSLAPDDHIKLFLTQDDGSVETRDYTPRRFDNASCSLTVDFAIHDAGPATQWARNARPGDTLQIGGPRGSAVVTYSFDWWLFIGDETALPAMGRWVEELPKQTEVITLAAVASPADEQSFSTAAKHNGYWVHRDLAMAADPGPLVNALRQMKLPSGRGFVWAAAEASVARGIRNYCLNELAMPKECVKASGYWKRGETAAHEKFDT